MNTPAPTSDAPQEENWQRLSNAELGAMVRQICEDLPQTLLEGQRPTWLTGCGLLLCNLVEKSGSKELTIRLPGFEFQGVAQGEWKIIISRINPPPSSN